MASEGGREVAWSRVVGRWPHTAGMGTWGPGIFSNDTACDVRVAYRMALEDGLDDQAAQHQVLDEFAEVLHDDTWNDGPLVWLALAKTQWQLGRLDDHVKAEALAVIDQGRDLASWEGSDLYGYRRAVLGRLRQQLTTPPPPRKRIRPPRRVDPEAVRRRLPYQEGSVFQLPLRDGRSARGLVSRLDPGSGLIIAYFFGPAAKRPWAQRPTRTAMRLPPRPEHIARCPDDYLCRRRWPVLGRLKPAAWSSWPPPPYDQPPSISTFVGTSYATPRLPEEMLSRWLSTTPTRFRRSGERYWSGAVEHALTLPDVRAAHKVCRSLFRRGHSPQLDSDDPRRLSVLDKDLAAPGLLERRAEELALLMRRHRGTHDWSEVAL
jgi:hypothetical protein